MSLFIHQPPLKMIANLAAADTNGTAVALRERFAEFVPFQRHLATRPPTQNVNSAVSPVLAAVQFSGNIANDGANAVTTATFVSF
jgi:hypothetical protein